jgi:Mg-chelatase subunit ChlD
MARSNIWRSSRFKDKAREVAAVTRGISDYFGSAARDRDYRVTWAPIANTYGGTDVRHKRVILNPALLDKVSPEAPFTDEAVDLMQGVAAHEAGHAVIAATHSSERSYDGMIGNVVEDLMIDRGAFRHYNPGLAVETLALRDYMATDELVAIDKFWRENPEVCQPQQLLNLWACSRLFGDRLADLPNRKHERKYVVLLDVVADGLIALDDFTGYSAQSARVQAINDINVILAEYQSITPKPAPTPEPGETGEGNEGEGTITAAHTPDDYEKGNEADKPEDSDSGTDADDRINDESDEPAKSPKGGKASKAPTREDWDASVPDVCPGLPGESVAPDSETNDPEFWKDVARELELLDIARPRVTGKVHMARYTDKRTVAGVRSAYAALASEPTPQRHHDNGRIDRHRLAFATARDDVFTRQRDKALSGKVVILLDLSGSTRGYEPLIKSSAASVYEALAKTDLDVWVYGYGNPNVSQLATPKKVFPAFDTVQAGGGTPTTEAFAAALNEVKPRSGESNVIIHVTDGVAGDVPSAIAQMDKARRAGWKVLNIGIGSSGSNLPYAKVSDSQQSIEDYTKLPTLLAAAVKDIVRGHKRKLSV